MTSWLKGAAPAALLALAGAAAAAPLVPLPTREFNAAALRAESQLRVQAGQPLRVEFHRAQGFRSAGGTIIVSLLAWPEGGAARCVLALEQGGAPQLIDALAEDQGQPWSCDGEPALAAADVDGDGAEDLLVLYPYRPPSNERFMLPLLLRQQAAHGGFALDAERTRWLRQGARLPADLKQMRQTLRDYPR